MTWLLPDLSASFVSCPVLKHSNIRLRFLRSQYHLQFLPFLHALSSMLNVLLPMAFKLRSYLSFKLHSSMTSSGKLSLMLQNNLCNSHRTSQYTYHKSMYFLSFSSSWLEDKKFTNHLNCTKNVLRTPLPFVIRCIIWDKLFNLFKPRDSPLKYVDNTSTNSWYC